MLAPPCGAPACGTRVTGGLAELEALVRHARVAGAEQLVVHRLALRRLDDVAEQRGRRGIERASRPGETTICEVPGRSGPDGADDGRVVRARRIDDLDRAPGAGGSRRIERRVDRRAGDLRPAAWSQSGTSPASS